MPKAVREGSGSALETGLARCSGMMFEYLATGRGPRQFGEPIRTLADEREDCQPLSDQQRRVLAWFESLTARQRKGLFDLLGK